MAILVPGGRLIKKPMRASRTESVGPALPRGRGERMRLAIAVLATTAAILVLAAGSIAWQARVGAIERRGATADSRAIAVLPFVTGSDDPNVSSIGIGLADALIGRLSAVDGLTVRPLSAALAVGGADAAPVEAGRALRAATVLHGTYDQDGERRIEVRVRLVDVATGSLVMTRDLPAQQGDLFQVEERVVQETLAAVAPHAARSGAASAVPREPDARAHYLYLMARSKLATLESPAVADAMRLLEEAVQADPSYALAHAALAEASAMMFLGGLTDQAVWLDRAVAEGRRAVHLNGRDPEAHRALGHALLAAGDPVEATRETLLALRGDPEHPLALRQLALLLAAAGEAGRAAALRDRALLQDPLIELGWLDLWIALGEGKAAALIPALEEDAGRRREAGRSPEQPIMQLGYLSFLTGDAGSGLRWAAMLDEVSANTTYTDMVRLLAYARTGDVAAVERIVALRRRALWRDFEYCGWVAQALAMVGRREEAIEWLKRSVELGNFTVQFFRSSEALDDLRTDPRFLEAFATVHARAGKIVQLALFGS